MKKKAVIGFVAALCLGSSMTAFAAPEVMPDGTVFDAEYYAENNPDVVAAFGNDKDLLYQHYMLFGKAEGRQPIENRTTQTAEDHTAQQFESYRDCLTTDMPVFPAEVTAKNNILVPVVLDPLDGHYLKYTGVVTRTNFGIEGRRKDYSNDPLYLSVRDYIIEWLDSNQGNKSNRDIRIPIKFRINTTEELSYFRDLIDNLEIDLHKSDICKDKVLFMGINPADAVIKMHGGEDLFFCSIDYWETPTELFNEHIKDEIPINPSTGLPAKVGESWWDGYGLYIVD